MNIDKDGGISIELDTLELDAMMKDIEHALGDRWNEAPRLLAKAINDTAKKAQLMIAGKAQETFTVSNVGFKKALPIKPRAKASNLEAILRSEGEPMDLSRFRVKQPTSDAAAAQVKRSGQSKSLIGRGGAKAFLVKFGSGHKAVAQRYPGEMYQSRSSPMPGSDEVHNLSYRQKRHLDPTRIKKLVTISVPQRLGDEKDVYGKIEDKIGEMLQDAMATNIKKALRR